jgi:hypothetical protein
MILHSMPFAWSHQVAPSTASSSCDQEHNVQGHTPQKCKGIYLGVAKTNHAGALFSYSGAWLLPSHLWLHCSNQVAGCPKLGRQSWSSTVSRHLRVCAHFDHNLHALRTRSAWFARSVRTNCTPVQQLSASRPLSRMPDCCSHSCLAAWGQAPASSIQHTKQNTAICDKPAAHAAYSASSM